MDNLAMPADLTTNKTKQAVNSPRLYRIVLINDDFTPMDFVVLVLMKFFAMDTEKAVRVMFTIHNEGKGECGVYTREIAETKMVQVNSFARKNKHPLLCKIEKCTT